MAILFHDLDDKTPDCALAGDRPTRILFCVDMTLLREQHLLIQQASMPASSAAPKAIRARMSLGSTLAIALLCPAVLLHSAPTLPPRIEPRPAHILLVEKAKQQYSVVRLLFRGGGSGAEQPFTNSVIWCSSNRSVFTVDSNGLVAAVGPGTAQLSVRSATGAAQGSTTITVSATALSSIAVNPGSLILPKGLQQQYRALGTFADNTTLDLTEVVTWSTSTPNIGSISNAYGSQGLATAMNIGGPINIQAFAAGVSGTAALTVSAPIPAAITIAPPTALILVGNTQSYSGTVTLTDGSTQPLSGATWTSSNQVVAAIDSTGVATGKAPGVTDISAQASGLKSNAVALSVDLLGLVSATSPFPVGCEITPQGTILYENAEVEPWLAVDPLDSKHLVGIWQQDRWRKAGGAHGSMTAVSHDGGLTWTRNYAHFSICSGGTAVNGADFERVGDPWVTISPGGNVYESGISYNVSNANTAVMVVRSTDGGDTWSNPTQLISDNQFQIYDDKDSITADPVNSNYVYAIWNRLVFLDAGETRFSYDQAWLAITSNGGSSWSASPIFKPANGLATSSHEIVVLPDGTLIDFFEIYNYNNQAAPVSIVVLRSSDHGATWSGPFNVNSFQDINVIDVETGELVRKGVFGNIAVDPQSGELYTVWGDARFSAGQRQGIALSKSGDGGLSWSAPVQVNQAPNVQAFAPGVAVAADGTIAVTYYDFRNDTPDPTTLLTTYWRIISHDGGVTWSETALAPPFDLRTAPYSDGYMVTDYEGLVAAGPFVSLFIAANSGDVSNPTDVFTFSNGINADALLFTNPRIEVNPYPRAPGEVLPDRLERRPRHPEHSRSSQ